MKEKHLNPTTHPEHFCQRCGGKNLIAWYSDADEWNKIVGDEYSIICPICFGELAEIKGLRPSAWRISREGDSPEVDKLRLRIHDLIHSEQSEIDELRRENEIIKNRLGEIRFVNSLMEARDIAYKPIITEHLLRELKTPKNPE